MLIWLKVLRAKDANNQFMINSFGQIIDIDDSGWYVLKEYQIQANRSKELILANNEEKTLSPCYLRLRETRKRNF